MQPNYTNDRTLRTTYTLDTLAIQYQSVRPVRTVKKQMEVTDEEVCVFLNHCHWIWPYVFWAFSGIVAVLMMCGVINN
ncbi:hypothetical protein RRV45_15285 [Bacillus sp. DTU_2020_1000418_1_SI_GHA_SEK_038]|uniref:hypothetical protein n=1 Tax=Bacillus sp. DTU_2020_1000418_1_SI_GHA_SEK_038 TaxID=3077585 RepID=UPI0028E7DD87|nr:hypothetical protein [Bacillus sp. DTU_2020_1000418_1_SI_GHA_SEK_038]WNS74273.1 hypothetical protein RRV45_15285 [Bacillus sp. DTU_2020_1000418_1_SI_GHA_SEK_038]